MGDNSNQLQHAVLVFRAGSHRCALPLSCVAETMRPLPIQSVAGMPAFVRGASIIRGQPVPVVDLACLLGGDARSVKSRFVVVRVEQRRVALAVEEVIGVEDIGAIQAAGVPPLLQEAWADYAAALGAADEKLLIVLSAGRILPNEVWEALAK